MACLERRPWSVVTVTERRRWYVTVGSERGAYCVGHSRSTVGLVVRVAQIFEIVALLAPDTTF